MALSSRDRVLYARHLLLTEIGSTGQEQLCATHAEVPEHADQEAAAVAVDYLQRAGIKVRFAGNHLELQEPSRESTELNAEPSSMVALQLPDAFAIDALAGEPKLRYAAAALIGAFAATEAIKQALGRGTAAAFPAQLSFVSEDA